MPRPFLSWGQKLRSFGHRRLGAQPLEALTPEVATGARLSLASSRWYRADTRCLRSYQVRSVSLGACPCGAPHLCGASDTVMKGHQSALPDKAHLPHTTAGTPPPAANSLRGRASTASMVAQVLGRIVAQIVTAMRVGFVALCSGPDCGGRAGEASQDATSGSPPAQMGAEWVDRS